MTEHTRSKRPSASLVFWASILLFAALFALLAFRFAAEQSASQATARAVQVRKVIKRRVVTTIVPSPGRNTVSASPVSSSSSYAAAEPVVTSSS
ncbi:MAG TPA: hypothetical protein VFN18_06890 [Solirubrobacterales bacterium]|nr:hypothetical protein [Solirubrobacterales bacterium]